MSYRIWTASGVAALSLLFAGGLALAQYTHNESHEIMSPSHHESEAGHSHEMSMIHGGEVTMTPHHHFEVLFTDKQARVYCYDDQQKPIDDLKDMTATMTWMMKDGTSMGPMNLRYMAPDPAKGRTQGYFYADRDTSKVKDGDAKAMFRMMGLEKDPIEFRTAVMTGEPASYVCTSGKGGPYEDPCNCPDGTMAVRMMGSGGPMMGEHMGGHMHGHMGGHMRGNMGGHMGQHQGEQGDPQNQQQGGTEGNAHP
jgi:hypothetical protein